MARFIFCSYVAKDGYIVEVSVDDNQRVKINNGRIEITNDYNFNNTSIKAYDFIELICEVGKLNNIKTSGDIRQVYDYCYRSINKM